ncbi:FAD:protein FMN transferase [Desulfosporosinus sp. OT]|uniref:FAD:protein FMN transferase n=1 Tax=Desulfosporosinus sp. OT TaxID=913865 RepID=UPI000223A811|nr:FAD:protein FMN transferase [Desulfosporosinus sp. OT]EGW36259.1 apbE family protein [Desulfosporosinus sp. OT]
MRTCNAKESFVKSQLFMDTMVSIKIVTSRGKSKIEESMERAFAAFHHVECVCSRFNSQSEISHLSTQVGIAVPVSPLLFEAVRFAWEVADFTEGAFDPTIGNTLAMYGFNCNYLTGYKTIPTTNADTSISYLDIELNNEEQKILLKKPLILDLGAVAKGLAVDLAVKDLAQFEGFLIDAGGDIFTGGMNDYDEPWRIGIRHPSKNDEIIRSLQLTNMAVCTSGSYERVSPIRKDTHHLINPHSKIPMSDILSCTVIAPFTMLADAFSTAAFILGREKGLQQLELAGLGGLLITPTLEMFLTKEMRRYLL